MRTFFRVVKTTLTWSMRLSVMTTATAAWGLFALLILAMALPRRFPGLDADMSLANVLLVLSGCYYAACIPALCLPLNTDHRYRWFLYLECGWMMALLGGMAALWGAGRIAIVPLEAVISARESIVATSFVFLFPMFLVLMVEAKGPRRLATVLSLMFVWLATQAVLFMGLPQLEGSAAEWLKVGLPIVSLLLMGLTVSLTLPTSATWRGDLLALVFFLWSFVLMGVFTFGIRQGWVGDLGQSEFAVFACLALTLVAAPLFNWMGLPWSQAARPCWLVCSVVSFVVVGWGLLEWKVVEGNAVLVHVWENYTGPSF